MRGNNGNLIPDLDGILTGRDNNLAAAVDAGNQQILL